MASSDPFLFLLTAGFAAALSACLTWAIRPLLRQVAMAKPNARSSHRIPTPQGGGIAVIAATLVVAATCAVAMQIAVPALLFVAVIFMALVGAADDIKSVPVLPRLLLQAAAVSAVVYTLPSDVRLFPAWQFVVERGLLVLAGLWFVNLVNFMDGLDLMTVAEIVPVTAAMVLLGLLGGLTSPTALVAAALCGAMLGFAPFNRPVATIFLGDVGSLPIGLLAGWCLMQLAGHQHVIAALLLPLYYLTDATLTLARRIANGEPFWAAHRTHYYQQATDNGFSVPRVVGEVFVLNLVLAGLAIASALAGSVTIDALTAIAGAAAVTLLLFRFSRRRLS
jgi:UDP-N-acetylmuramyl pentapeptide phosphotransferase/UDP-N-acetylglucosamine-1-phosphate transferase